MEEDLLKLHDKNVNILKITLKKLDYRYRL